MTSSVHRLRVVAICCCFPLAIIGLTQEKKAAHTAIRWYYTAILAFSIFLIGLAIYTYTRGGNFIPVLGTFY
ncbi:MAG: hypothetical protein JST90_17115 [Bacteroidetes bacterium]|nr:hypothetical protein [Bacteroidota bacterium]